MDTPNLQNVAMETKLALYGLAVIVHLPQYIGLFVKQNKHISSGLAKTGCSASVSCEQRVS